MAERLIPLALACAALLGGCATMAPTYQRPAAAVATGFDTLSAGTNAATAATESATPPTAVPAEPASSIAWQQYFADERLKRLIDIALANNRDLRIATLNIEQARAQHQVRRADQWPTVGAGLSGQRQTTTGGHISSVYSAGLSVTAYELDLFGRVRSLSDAALAQYLGTEEARKAAQISLIAAVANTYYAWLADETLLEVTRQTLATREESFKLTRLKFDNGASSELDFRQSESLLEGARVSLAQLTRQRALDQNALVLLLGQGFPADLPAGRAVTDQQVTPDLPAGVPSEVLARRPDVRQAEQALIASHANIGAARAALFPRISLTGSAGVASNELSGLFNHATGAWSFLPQLTLPIFDGGRNRANLEVAQVNREIALAQYDKALQTAFREVADALAGRATLGEQARAQLAQTQAEEVRFKLADLRYRNGAASYLDVLDAQRAWFGAQQAVVQVQVAQAQNLVTLYKALGGGWQEATPAR